MDEEKTDEEYFAAWSKVAEMTSKAACDRLIEQGIGYVYGRGGRVFRRNPDGSETEIVSTHEKEE